MHPFYLLNVAALTTLTLPGSEDSPQPKDTATPPADTSKSATAEEIRRLEELRAEVLELVGGVEGLPASARTTPTQDNGPKVQMRAGNFRVTSADGESSIKIGGRTQVDANNHTREGGLDDLINDGTEMRRIRFELKGTLPESLVWAAEVDFADNGTSVKDWWIGRELDSGPLVTVGHQKQPYSLDIEESSNDIPFVERGIDAFLILPFVDRAIGLRVQDSTDSFFYAAGVYGESVRGNAVDDEGWGLAGRVVYAPVIEDDRVVHLGARAAYRMPDEGADSIRIRNETTNMSNFSVVDTGTLMDVDSVFMYGPEAVYAQGPFSIGGELNLMDVESSTGDSDFDSWNVQATYSLTGESRAAAYRLDAGEFKRLRAEAPGQRPLELAARIATIDVEDGSVTGGEADTLSLGLNYYYSPNLRVMLNWTNYYDTDGGSAETAAAEDLSVFTLRFQMNF